MLLLNSIANKENNESLSALLTFWNNKVRPKLSHFFVNKNLLTIIDELDQKIEKYEAKKEATQAKLLKTKQKSFSYLRQSTTSRYTRHNFLPISSDFSIKEEDDDISLILNNKKEALSSPIFNCENEIENENIIYEKGIVKFISIDLFIKKLGLGEVIFNDKTKNDEFYDGLTVQYIIFLKSDTFIGKLISAFNFFYSRYMTNEDENSDTDEIMLNVTKMPLDIISYINRFVKLQAEYNLNYLTTENIKKLKEFYDSISNIYDVKNNLLPEIEQTLKYMSLISFQLHSQTNNTLNRSDTLIMKFEPFNIFSYGEDVIAKELTRISYKLFKKIEFKEFFNSKFSKKDKHKNSPNIMVVVERFNDVSFFAIEEILSYDHKAKRGQVIEKLITIAHNLKNLNNFYDCMSIIASLNHIIIQKMKKTWKCVSTNHMNLYNTLKKFVDFQDNFKGIRIQMEECIQKNIPFIPFLGLYTKRICFLDEGPPYIKNGVLINCQKIMDVYLCLREFFKFKNVGYLYEKEPGLLLLQFLKPLSEEELEHEAELLEPAFILTSRRQVLKRKTNTEKNFEKILNSKSPKMIV